MRELDEVVEEADRAAGERREQNGEPAQRVVRQRQEGDGRRKQDEQAAHRRRPLLRSVMLGAILANVRAELVAAQELDEARADGDRHDQRDESCDQDTGHSASASATTSRPTEREPLTSTASPGLTISRATATASAAVGAHASGS